jgi:hypothetical protein
MKRTTFLSLCAMLLVSAMLLWARDDHMVNSSIVPAAQGTVHTDTDRNGNTSIELEVHRLAKPTSLQPAYSHYVVWVQPPGESPIDVGELRVNDDLNGSLKTTTPHKKFDIFATAENDPRPAAPSGPEVMHASVNRE